MSTIASPRPSITVSSRRTSSSTDNVAQTPSADRGSLRRNRAALRDYYGLESSDQWDGKAPPAEMSLNAQQESELDTPNFDVNAYVQSLLAKEDLEGILNVEAGLVSDIRNLDGEKKALVYDNYSKLIAATDTIKSMRERMDPMAPATSTLTPAISHITESASALSEDLKKVHAGANDTLTSTDSRRQAQQATVRWVLDAPRRLEALAAAGKRTQATEHWNEISSLLDSWKGVRGTDNVRNACMQALEALKSEAKSKPEEG